MSPYTENHLLDALMLALVYAPPAHDEVMQLLDTSPVVENVVEVVEEIDPAPPEIDPEPEPDLPPDPAPDPAPAATPAGSVWDDLAQCESNGEWDYGPHSGWGSGKYEGGLQFHPGTWDAYKPSGYPEAAYQASREQQIEVAEKVRESQGWGAWPACSRKLGLR